MAYDAFISYRRADRITADGVARFLDAFGLTVFIDRSSRAGEVWEPELLSALESAKVLVVLWSRSAAKSGWVQKEWELASPACRIVPLRLDGEPLPAGVRAAIPAFGPHQYRGARRFYRGAVDHSDRSRRRGLDAQPTLITCALTSCRTDRRTRDRTRRR